MSARHARSAAILVGVALAGCAVFTPIDRSAEIAPALADLRGAGFEFAPDIHFVHYRITVCEGITCADLVEVGNRRTIRLADSAFANPSKLRATLLEIWPRYNLPRRPDAAVLARSALLVVNEGERVGVTDPEVQREARFVYKRLFGQVPSAERAELPSPESLPPVQY